MKEFAYTGLDSNFRTVTKEMSPDYKFELILSLMQIGMVIPNGEPRILAASRFPQSTAQEFNKLFWLSEPKVSPGGLPIFIISVRNHQTPVSVSGSMDALYFSQVANGRKIQTVANASLGYISECVTIDGNPHPKNIAIQTPDSTRVYSTYSTSARANNLIVCVGCTMVIGEHSVAAINRFSKI